MDEDAFVAHVKEQFAKLPPIKKSFLVIYDEMMGFYYAVSWSKEPWLQGILAMHVVLLALVILGRRRFYLQGSLFMLMSGLVFASETINRVASERWKEFSTQNYFDNRGVFLGTIFSGPLLFTLLVQLLLTLRNASQLVVTVKRHEFGLEKKKKA